MLMSLTKEQVNLCKKYVIVGLFWLNILIITAVWVRNMHWHGQLSGAFIFTALGHITGLLSAFTILCLLILMSRIWILEDAFGMEEITKVHRKISYWAIYLLIAHAILLTIGYQLTLGESFASMFIKFATGFEDVFRADLGLVLFLLVMVTSIVVARKKLKYEVWYVIHLLAYLAVLLGFQHQLAVGIDFVGHPLFIDYWYALYILAALLLIVFRIGWQLLVFNKHRFRLVRVQQETHDTHTFILKGKNLQQFHYQPGQFAIWHVLAPGVWWQSHPFSFSSIPNNKEIHFTAKSSGDFTTKLATIRPGASVIIDGPHGKFTKHTRDNDKLLYIAGGVGITPLYSMISDLAPQRKDIVLLVACRTAKDIIFHKEIEAFKKFYGIDVHYLFSADPKATYKYVDATALQVLVPDLQERTVYLCGPPPMMDSVSSILRAQGVSKKQIHTERFDY